LRRHFTERALHTLFLARDTWITVAIAALVFISIEQGHELIGEVALGTDIVWAIVGTTYWSVSAYYFTRQRYRHIIQVRHKDAIAPSQSVTTAFIAGLAPIGIAFIAMNLALPEGVVAIDHYVIPAVSLVAGLAIVLLSRLVYRLVESNSARHPAARVLSRIMGAVLFAVLVSPGVIIFVLGLIVPIETSRVLDSYPLFSIWAGFAIAVLYGLQNVSERVGLPLTGIIVIGALVITAILPERHRGHAIRDIQSGLDPHERVALRDAFRVWQASQPGTGPTTMILVAAPGGGIVSALWTGISLGRLRDAHGQEFDRDLFAISAVSGGSLGSMLYADAARPQTSDCLLAPSPGDPGEGPGLTRFERALLQFAAIDHTAAVALRLIYLDDAASTYVNIGDYADRSGVLERSWEQAWHEAVTDQGCPPAGDPTLSHSLLSLWYRADADGMSLIEPWQGVPFLLLNGTSLTSGRRIVTSPFVFPAQPMLPQQVAQSEAGAEVARLDTFAMDLLGLSSNDLRLSTAVNNSARFPWIEPAGRLKITAVNDGEYRYDLVVDGAYFDNSGARTMHDLIAEIVDACRASDCRPMRLLVVQLSSDPGDLPIAYAHQREPDRNPPGLWDDLLTPIYAGLVGQHAHNESAMLYLRRYVKYLPLQPDSPVVETMFAELPLPTTRAPNAWALSDWTIKTIFDDANDNYLCATGKDEAACSALVAVNVDGPPSTTSKGLQLRTLRHNVLHHAITCIDTFLAGQTRPDCAEASLPH